MTYINSFPAVIVLFFLLSSAFFAVQACPPHELQALLNFKYALNDSAGRLKSWTGSDCCAWEGVECDGTEEGRHVYKLALSGGCRTRVKTVRRSYCSKFYGEIPSQLGGLSFLRQLNLNSNNFHGQIPNTIGNLTSLKTLYLSFNNLEGAIPSSLSLLIDLSYLGLSRNQLKGPIPASLGNLHQLKDLSLGNNHLQGNIPTSLGDLLALEKLYISDNQLSGSLPLSFANLSSLAYLYADGNNLNGSIPSALMLPSSLQILYLSDNIMNGTITEVFFQKSLKLLVLDLSFSGLSINISSTWIPPFQLLRLALKNCQIGGPVPSWISTQFSLGELDLSTTQLMGSLPSWLWDIRDVRLSGNHLEGFFTPASGSLEYLDLSVNKLSGGLPPDIHMQLSKTEVLILGDNKFEGSIPTSIANLAYLKFLDMSVNYLTGNIPATLGNLTYLQALNLEGNYFQGQIPMELCSLSLQSLRIGKNILHGILPSCLRNSSRLQVLDVGENKLERNIPRWIANISSLHVLVMRSNNFIGVLPPDIGRMPELQVLDLSSNYFSGKIPDSYFRLPAMQNSSLKEGKLLMYDSGYSYGYSESIDLIIKGKKMHYQYILLSFTSFDLSNNRLTGPLPPEIENLKGLMYLNLSLNSLTGSIPVSLGNLLQLESLDLSSNKFSGQIPGELGGLTYLASLNLSFNNLCGKIPRQGGQMLTFDELSYIGNPNLWGCPLKRNCSRPDARASPPPAVGVEKNGDEGFEFLLYWMCFGLAVGLGFSVVVLVFMFKLSWRMKCFEIMDKVIYMLPKPKPLQG